jgi:hypothetical protein
MNCDDLPGDLASVVKSWAQLPQKVKDSILAIVAEATTSS